MARWLSWVTACLLALLGLVVLAGQEPAKVQSGVYLCSSAESPSLLQVEGVGSVRLIGVRVTEGTPQATRALELVKKLVEGKLVRIDVCPNQPKDDQGNVRAEVFYAEKGKWVSLNRRLIREGLAKLAVEPNCHIDFSKWQVAKPTVVKAQPAQRERRAAVAPPSLRAVPQIRREAPKPRPVMTRKSIEDLALRTMAVPIAFRDPLIAAEQRMVQASANLNAWREIRWRIDTLQRALLPVAARAYLTPWRFSQLVLRGQPSPLVASELNQVFASVGGEPFPQRIIRLGLKDRKETLAELLNWFPDIRQQLLQRLRNLGAQLVGGTTVAPTVGVGPTMGGPGAPMGPMGGGPMMMGGPGMGAHGGPMGGHGGPMISAPAGPGGPPPVFGEAGGEIAPPGFAAHGGAIGAPPGMPGAPPMMGGAPGAAPGGAAPAAAGAVSNFYRYMELARTGMIDPEFAAICVLALEAYREQVDEQIRLATAEYQRAREEWAELKEIIVRELRKLAATPLRR
ncbi:MAG: thermonuclease family protein [Armatimonadetes bacterium]|nr:thermonuclease family protein [Armatimonadota bacterium]